MYVWHSTSPGKQRSGYESWLRATTSSFGIWGFSPFRSKVPICTLVIKTAECSMISCATGSSQVSECQVTYVTCAPRYSTLGWRGIEALVRSWCFSICSLQLHSYGWFWLSASQTLILLVSWPGTDLSFEDYLISVASLHQLSPSFYFFVHLIEIRRP